MSKQLLVITGEVVYLKVDPVDPRDIFRGDYVILDYGEISHPDKNNIVALDKNDIVYANLVVDSSGIAKIKSFSQKPESDIFLRGKKNYYNNIKYGIESFFVPVQTGRNIERQIQKTDMYAEVVISRSGKSFVKNLRTADDINHK